MNCRTFSEDGFELLKQKRKRESIYSTITQNLLTNLQKGNNNGRWSIEEHKLFLEGVFKHGNKWKAISQLIKTRSSIQTRSHAQKFFSKEISFMFYKNFLTFRTPKQLFEFAQMLKDEQKTDLSKVMTETYNETERLLNEIIDTDIFFDFSKESSTTPKSTACETVDSFSSKGDTKNGSNSANSPLIKNYQRNKLSKIEIPKTASMCLNSNSNEITNNLQSNEIYFNNRKFEPNLSPEDFNGKILFNFQNPLTSESDKSNVLMENNFKELLANPIGFRFSFETFNENNEINLFNDYNSIICSKFYKD